MKPRIVPITPTRGRRGVACRARRLSSLHLSFRLTRRKVRPPMQHQSVALTVQADPASADPFLRATDVIDWTTPAIQALARDLAAGSTDPHEVARANGSADAGSA